MTQKKRRRFIYWSAAVVGILLVVALSCYSISRSRTFQFFGGIVNRVETTKNVVALTFDDGPSEHTDRILGVLDQAGIKATFFLNGNCIAQFPEETKRIVQAGHQVANHTYSHHPMVFLPLSTIASEIERTDRLIREAGYEGDIQFRPPNGKKLVLLPYYLNQHDRKTILWDIEPNSYPEVNSSAESIARYTVDHVRPGSIILLHVMYDKDGFSIGAVQAIAEGLKAKGYSFVTVNDLLRYNQIS